VPVKTTGYKKLRVSVMVCVTANDNKLKPDVLNGKTVPKENFYKDSIVWAQKNAWMALKLLEDWLGCVCERQPGALSKPWSMLAMDTFCLNKKDTQECACSENFRFPSYSSMFSITFRLKSVLNVLF
jgi:hypothetical protein